MKADKKESRVTAGDFVFVPSNEYHSFSNAGTEPLEFICIVPARGEEMAGSGQ